MLGGPPTTARAFAVGDTLTAYVELYRGEADATTIDLETSVIGPNNRLMFRSRDEITASQFQNNVHGHKIDVPLDGTGGNYTLKIVATPRAKTVADVREVPFYVVVPQRAPAER
jgi:hypothetical protein